MRLLGTFVLVAAGFLTDPYATLTGRVTDTAGDIVPGVEVMAINVETGAKPSVQTNDEGLYRITNLPPGAYRLLIRKPGFRTILKPGIELRVQDLFALNFEIQIGSEAESVTLEEGAPLLQAETAALGYTLDRDFIAELPTRLRTPYDFVGLTAGGSTTSTFEPADSPLPDFGTLVDFGVNGQRSSSGLFLLDGSVINTNPAYRGWFAPTPGLIAPNESVREFRVLTNGFTAEYGGSIGYIANLVTKRGTNEFHGSLYDYVQNPALVANSFDANARGLGGPFLKRHQPGGLLTGPVLLEKAFFTGAFESILQRTSSGALQFYVPTPHLIAVSSPATQALFRKHPLPTDLSTTEMSARTVRLFEGGAPVTLPALAKVVRDGPPPFCVDDCFRQSGYLGVARLDYALGERTALTVWYGFRHADEFLHWRQPYTPIQDFGRRTRNHSGTLNLTRTWSTGFMTESRLAVSRLLEQQYGDLVLEGHSFANYTDPASGALVRLPHERRPAGPTNFYQAHQTASWVRSRHNFRFGGDFVLYRQAPELLGNWQGIFGSHQNLVDGVFQRLDVSFDFLSNGLRPGVPVTEFRLPINTSRHVRYIDTAWFIQDSWRVTRRLTLTPGLRWEYFGAPSRVGHENTSDGNFYPGEGATYYERFANGSVLPVTEAPGEYRNHLVRPDRNNFAPRLGLAFDFTGDSKTVFRASAGIYFDPGADRMPTLISGRVSFSDVPLSAEMLEDRPYTIRDVAVSGATVFVRRTDPDRRAPYIGSWNATLERDLAGRVALSASYVGSSGSELDVTVLENWAGSGAYVGRPGQRLLNEYGPFQTRAGLAHSSYHSLQLRADGRPTHQLRLGANYTWSHSIDNFGEGPMFPGSLQLSRASSNFDLRHRLVTHFLWEIPRIRQGPGVLRQFTAGWQMSGILSFQTGQPFDLTDRNADVAAFTVRPRIAGPLPQTLSTDEMVPDPVAPNSFAYLQANAIRTPSGACLPNAAPFACFDPPYDSTDNVLPRNYYRRPGSYSQDFALTRNIRIHEQMRVQIRAESYNLLNHPTLFVGRSTSLTAATHVQARYAGAPRQVVLAAKIIF